MNAYTQFSENLKTSTESIGIDSSLQADSSTSSHGFLSSFSSLLSPLGEATLELSKRWAMFHWDAAVSASETILEANLAQAVFANEITVYEDDTTFSLPVPIAHNMQILQEAEFTKTTSSRIAYLANLEVGWYAGAGQTLNPLSLRNFLNLWLEIKQSAREPDLMLCANGNIQAEWFKSTKKNLTVEFRAGDAIYVLQDGDRYVPAIDDLENLQRTLLSRNPSPFTWGA